MLPHRAQPNLDSHPGLHLRTCWRWERDSIVDSCGVAGVRWRLGRSILCFPPRQWQWQWRPAHQSIIWVPPYVLE